MYYGSMHEDLNNYIYNISMWCSNKNMESIVSPYVTLADNAQLNYFDNL